MCAPRQAVGGRSMSTIELNKIVGAILLALLTLQVIGTIGDSLVRPRPAATVAMAVPEGRAPAAAPAEEKGPEPIAPLLAAADVAAGETAAKKCAACHTFNKGGANKIGPALWGIVGRAPGTHPGFSYSNAIKEKATPWTYEDLSQYLYSPRSYAPGNKMAFAGIKKTSERADVIAYLRTLADDPAPLPQP